MGGFMSFSWFISVDDHLIEPARLWQERLPVRWHDTGPRIVRDGSSEFWVYEDRQIVTTGLTAVAGKRREEFCPSRSATRTCGPAATTRPPGSPTWTRATSCPHLP
jgi:hypothetical protein